MTTRPINRVIQHLFAACERDGMTDGELLTGFLHHHDNAHFAALVRRHGRMVWGVCRRVLRSHHDAEDAFQATFLVLVKKAATLPNRETVCNWLYGVAHQTAIRLRAMLAKRSVRERQVPVMPEPATADEYVWNDIAPVVDEELSRLPEKYRLLIVLCDLEGMTRKEVARKLGIPEGTAASRLATARSMLARRLVRRGVVLSGALLGDVVSQGSASASPNTCVVSSTIHAAGEIALGQATTAIPVRVASLTEGVLKAMFLTKLKLAAKGLLVAALLFGVVGAIYHSQAAEPANRKQGDKSTEKSSKPLDIAPPKEAPRRKFSFSGVVKTGGDLPKQIIELPRGTLSAMQITSMHLHLDPLNLVAEAFDEKCKTGIIVKAQATPRDENKVNLTCTVEWNDIETANAGEVSVLGRNAHTMRVVELGKPTKLVLEKDAKGLPRRWAEITITERIDDEETVSPEMPKKQK